MAGSTSSPKLKISDPLMRGLVCAVLHQGLRSILVFDAEPVALQSLALILSQMFHRIIGTEPQLIQLGSVETEDNLWGQLTIDRDSNVDALDKLLSIRWQAGLLGSAEQKNELRLLVIPDITQLSLAAMRACVSVMGAEVAHLERHGQQQYWRPNCCWLAGCSKKQIGAVSPHLLDRFALRLTNIVKSPKRTLINTDIGESLKRKRVTDISKCLQHPSLDPDLLSILSLQEITEITPILEGATQHRPKLNPESLVRVEEYTSKLEVYSPRRSLALVRLAVAHAQLEGSEEVVTQHVDDAAETIGLQLPVPDLLSPDIDTAEHSKAKVASADTLKQELEEKADSSPHDIIPVDQSKSSTATEHAYASDRTETLDSTSVIEDEDLSGPYPEDTAEVQREVTTLKLPPRQFQTRTAAQSSVIGVEVTRKLHDLALVSTLLEAVKFQTIRRQKFPQAQRHDSRLIISPADLRCYRRAPVAEQMLALVMDHTCLHNCKWQEKLLPYMNWAYVERANVCLVQVGAKLETYEAQTVHRGVIPEELRAKKFVERSILVPHIIAGIEASAGRATPLAHGLELAMQTLRHTLQHGRSRVQRVLLVVVSDGRGNVPLADSHSGKIILPVKQQGIEDALKVAEQIRVLNNLDTVLLNPQPIHYPDLPLKLAQALNARIVDIPPIKSWEVEADDE